MIWDVRLFAEAGAHEGRPYGGEGGFIVERGCPRGTLLRGELGKIRKWEGRCGQGEGGMGPRMREDNGGGGDDGGGMGHIPVSTGAGSPWEQREGKGFSLWNDGLYGDGRFANRPYGRRSGCMGAIYFHSNHGRGRPRGAPLRGKVERAPTRDAPTGEGGKGVHEGRPYAGKVWWKVELRTTGFLAVLRTTCCTSLNDRSGWTQGLELHRGWRR